MFLNNQDDVIDRLITPKLSDFDVCLKNTIKSHATGLAVSACISCKKVVFVPTALDFIKSVLQEVVTTHQFSRKQIDAIVYRKAIEAVPVSELVGARAPLQSALRIQQQPTPMPIAQDLKLSELSVKQESEKEEVQSDEDEEEEEEEDD